MLEGQRVLCEKNHESHVVKISALSNGYDLMIARNP